MPACDVVKPRLCFDLNVVYMALYYSKEMVDASTIVVMFAFAMNSFRPEQLE